MSNKKFSDNNLSVFGSVEKYQEWLKNYNITWPSSSPLWDEGTAIDSNWTTITTNTLGPIETKDATKIGTLHFDLDSGRLFVTITDSSGVDYQVDIESIDDLKKLATKHLLKSHSWKHDRRKS